MFYAGEWYKETAEDLDIAKQEYQDKKKNPELTEKELRLGRVNEWNCKLNIDNLKEAGKEDGKDDGKGRGNEAIPRQSGRQEEHAQEDCKHEVSCNVIC